MSKFYRIFFITLRSLFPCICTKAFVVDGMLHSLYR